MAFYFSSDTKALYDTDVFPVASLPANKVEITPADYANLMTKQNQGYVILADSSGNPYAVAQGESTATNMKHSGTVATTLVLGHVKIGNTIEAANDGTIELKDGAVSTAKIADANVTTDKLADGSVTEAKLESVKDLEADESTLTMTEDANGFTFGVKDGGIGTQQIADQSVTTAKIADVNVTTPKIADAAVTTQKIAIGAVTSEQILTDAVNTSKIRDSAVTTAKIADANVTTPKIADAAVTTQKIAIGAVTSEQILTDAVNTPKIRDSAVTTAKIANAAVTSDKIDKVRGKNIELSNVFDTETQISVSGDGPTVIDVYQVLDCLAGSIFRFVVGFKNISIYPFSEVTIQVKDADGNIAASLFSQIISGTDWHDFSLLGSCQVAGTIKVSFTLNATSTVRNPSVRIDGFVIR